jgi:hypothetical protein
MTGPCVVIGIDPGPIPGFVVLDLARDAMPAVEVVQCSHRAAPTVLAGLLTFAPDVPVHVQIETFVVGRASMRSGQHGAVTRDLVGRLREVWEGHDSTIRGRRGGHWFQRSAAQVKPWATDRRLQAAVCAGDTSLWLATAGMRHARDGARHALYCAVHDAGVSDPLSKEARNNR